MSVDDLDDDLDDDLSDLSVRPVKTSPSDQDGVSVARPERVLQGAVLPVALEERVEPVGGVHYGRKVVPGVGKQKRQHKPYRGASVLRNSRLATTAVRTATCHTSHIDEPRQIC